MKCIDLKCLLYNFYPGTPRHNDTIRSRHILQKYDLNFHEYENYYLDQMVITIRKDKYFKIRSYRYILQPSPTLK